MTKKKKRTRMIAAVLLLAVLAVTYVLVLRADFNGEDVEEETEEITVLEIEREDISTVRLENSYGTLQFAYDGETWTSEDDPAFQLNQDSMSALFNRLNPLTAVRDLESRRIWKPTALRNRLSQSRLRFRMARKLPSTWEMILQTEICIL